MFEERSDDPTHITETCPRCGCRALVVHGSRVPGVDRIVAQAFCTSCGLVAMEPPRVDEIDRS